MSETYFKKTLKDTTLLKSVSRKLIHKAIKSLNTIDVITHANTLISVVHYLNHRWNCGMCDHPDSKIHGANMGPIWGRQDPGGPHVGLLNFAIN